MGHARYLEFAWPNGFSWSPSAAIIQYPAVYRGEVRISRRLAVFPRYTIALWKRNCAWDCCRQEYAFRIHSSRDGIQANCRMNIAANLRAWKTPFVCRKLRTGASSKNLSSPKKSNIKIGDDLNVSTIEPYELAKARSSRHGCLEPRISKF